ncbi:hypothetical protein EAI_07649 [Harpegnathos saltator]|uniref:Uncharacterized protein n=1 Tax=Harpegnathos saltator TaxID=610380 RepID=E2B4P8_HARSA|nr:hypothetical protein EAI_07649 [Harpegnathos saltator]
MQKVIAKIKMIEFSDGSHSRVYKNRLKKIVIDTRKDKVEIEKLISRDKKRNRDKHKLASYAGYPGNTPEGQKASSDGEEDTRRGGSDFAESFVDSLEFGHQAKSYTVDSNAGVTAGANRHRAGNARLRGNEGAFTGKSKNQIRPVEALKETERRSDCYFRANARPLRLGERAENRRQIDANVNTNLNINSLNYKLAGGDRGGRTERRVEDAEVGKKNDTSTKSLDEEVSPDDAFSVSTRDELRTIKDTNATERSDDEEMEKASADETLYNSWSGRDGEHHRCIEGACKGRQKSAGEAKGGAGISPHTDVNSGLLTPNSYGTPAGAAKKSREISPEDTEEKDQSDTEEEEEEDEENEEEEEDYRSSANLSSSSVDSTEGQETSTKDNCISRLINPDASIAEKNNKDDLKPGRRGRPRVEQKRQNITHNRDKSHNVKYNRSSNYDEKIAKLDSGAAKGGEEATTAGRRETKGAIRGTDSETTTTIASRVAAGTKRDGNREEAADECADDDTCESSGDAGSSSAAEAERPRRWRSSSAEDSDEDFNEDSNVNSNVNANLNRLIKPWR